MAILNWYGDKAIENMERAKSIALKASALVVEGQAKLLCPVGHYPGGKVGGNLRNSITNEIEGQEARIGTNVEYGPYVELGTGRRGSESPSPPKSNIDGTKYNQDWPGAPAQPFLNPSLDRNKKNIAKIFAQTIAEVMED